MEALSFPALAFVTNAASKMAYIERWREGASKTNETGFLTWGIFEPRVLSSLVRIMNHIAQHGTLPGLEGYDWFK
jgi:hypothetical protein